MTTSKEETATENTMQDVYDDELSNQDYGFVFNSDGDLKSVFFPSEYFVVPESMLAIFQMYGIDDPESFATQKTLH